MQGARQIALRQQWSTEDVEPRQALAYWVETICRSFLEIDIESPDATRFQARLDSADLGPGSLYLVQARAQHIRRTPARIARSRAAYTILMQIREGRQEFRQHGRECSLGPGDCVVVDCKEPYELDCLGPTRAVVLRFPHEWLTGWLPAVEDAAARTFRAGEGWGGALSAAMAALDGFSANAVALPPGAVAEQIAGLLALAAGPTAQATDASVRLYRQLHDALRARSHEAGLAPSAFAMDQGISPRYLHHVFAAAGTTFGSELVSLRLATARRLLADRRHAAVPVGELAARCGFADPSHFARRFRLAFGLGPSEFRRQVLAG